MALAQLIITIIIMLHSHFFVETIYPDGLVALGHEFTLTMGGEYEAAIG